MHRELTLCCSIAFLLVASGARSEVQYNAGPPGRLNVLLEWADNTDKELMYVIQRANSPDGPWKRAGTTDANVTTFLDRNLKPTTTYYYRVCAVWEEGYSEYSNVMPVITAAAATPPKLRKQPVGLVAQVGTDVVISADVIGTPPLSCQWRFNGRNLPGETDANLALTDVQQNQIGNYSLLVRNANGAVVSYSARLSVTTPLTLTTNGPGRVFPHCDATDLELGRRYSIRAYPASGCSFLGWTGSATSKSASLTFVMSTNLEYHASFRDVARPLVTVTSPLPNVRVTNSFVTLKGVARDNQEVVEVKYRLNDGDWNTASGTTNWFAELNLVAGRNTLRTYAVDPTGNCSLTNIRYVTYVVNLPLIVQTNGSGMTTPDYDAKLLEIGKSYSITATRPGPGFVFTNWTISDDLSEAIFTNKPTLLFQMRSNLVLQANFLDVKRPVISVSNTLPTGELTSGSATVLGAASDNDRVASISYQLNDGPWLLADGTTNWSASLVLVSGTNVFRAYSEDATGNRSITNTLTTAVEILPSESSLRRSVSGNQPKISHIHVAEGVVTVSFNSVVGVLYSLEHLDALSAPEWIASPFTVPGTGGPLQLTDPNPPSAGRFYRIRVSLP